MTWEGQARLGVEGTGAECTEQNGALSSCRLTFDALSANDRESLEVRITLRNEGTSPLGILGLQLENQESLSALIPPPFAATTLNLADSYTLANGDVITLYPTSAPECGPSELTLVVTYLNREGLLPTAMLQLVTDAPNVPTGLLPVHLVASGNGPRVAAKPQHVVFQNIVLNELRQQKLVISNVGNQTLYIYGFELHGNAGFKWMVPEHESYPNPEGGSTMLLSPFITLYAGDTLETTVYFTSQQGQHWTGLLRIRSNDPYAPGGFEIPLVADVASACASVYPPQLDFATQPLGTTAPRTIKLSSCEAATEHLAITDIRLADGAQYSSYFSLDLSELPSLPSAASPMLLEAGQQVQFKVRYKPQSLSLPGPDGTPVPHAGLVEIVTSEGTARLEVPLVAACGVAPCPKAVIQVAEGDLVYPGTELHLVGSGSAPAAGNLTGAKWSLKPPHGGVEKLQPNVTAFDITYRATLVGVHEFTLDVWDQTETKSCQSANYAVTALPVDAIYVQLTWHTPGDADESDSGPEAGSDLDLHFAHQWASQPDLDGDGMPDPWFDNQFDCFWFNTDPDWGHYAPDSNDNPSMLMDDSDGGGPEALALDNPQDDHTYSIGVHYWDEHGYGDSLARVRVYIYGSLVYDTGDVRLLDRDMWFVARLHWPSGLIDPVIAEEGGPAISPQYPSPYFQ